MARKRPGQTFEDAHLRRLIGTDLIHRITEKEPGKAPLRIGTQVWSTHDLAVQLGVVHTRAARLLTVAAESIGAKSVRDLYQRSSPYTFSGVKGLGETTMYVLWRLFESAGLDVDKWADAGDSDEALVSFRTMKLREQAAEARTHAAEKARKRRVGRAVHEVAVSSALR